MKLNLDKECRQSLTYYFKNFPYCKIYLICGADFLGSKLSTDYNFVVFDSYFDNLHYRASSRFGYSIAEMYVGRFHQIGLEEWLKLKKVKRPERYRDKDGDIQTLDLAGSNMEIRKLRKAIRTHRDERGHERCWQSDNDLYMVLPEKLPHLDKLPPYMEWMNECEKHCQKYWTERQKPNV